MEEHFQLQGQQSHQLSWHMLLAVPISKHSNHKRGPQECSCALCKVLCEARLLTLTAGASQSGCKRPVVWQHPVQQPLAEQR